MKNIDVFVRIPIKLRDLILKDAKKYGMTMTEWFRDQIEIRLSEGESEADADIEDQIETLNNCIEDMKAQTDNLGWFIENYEDQIKILEKQSELLAEINDLDEDDDDLIDKRAELEKLENKLIDLRALYEDSGDRVDSEYKDDLDLDEDDEDFDDGKFGTD